MDIKTIRKLKKMTQQELAEAIGVDKATISKYESGKLNPSINRLKAIASVLDVSVNCLLDDDAQAILVAGCSLPDSNKLINIDTQTGNIRELQRQLDFANQEIESLKSELKNYSDMYNSASAEIKRLHSVIRSMQNEN